MSDLMVDADSLDMIVVRVEDFEKRGRDRIALEFETLSRRLSEAGSLFLILEWDHAYDMKLLVDDVLGGVFGKDNCLRNEIVYVDRQARSNRGAVEKHFTIFWYVKDHQLAPFERLTMPKSSETRKRFGDGKIISSVSLRTGRRAPTRIEGESMATPLNDVWVWDRDLASWVYELEEMDGRVMTKAAGVNAVDDRGAAEEALESRLKQLTGCRASGRILKTNL